MTTNDDKQHLLNFYSVLKEKLRLYRDAKKRLDRFLSTDFNVFKWIDPNEDCLSHNIANLLNPACSHGQQRVFLDAFLRRIGKDALCYKQPTRVVSQYPFKHIFQNTLKEGKLDILVEFKDFVIAIENKPWAQEGDKQLLRYSDYLNNKYNNQFCLIYLTPSGDEPRSIIDSDDLKRLMEHGKLLCIAYYSDILEWLRECCQLCESAKFREFLRDFTNYVPTMEESMSKSSDRESIVEHALENKENLKIALDVCSVYDDLRKQLIKGFATKLKECLENHLGMAEWVCIEDGLVRDPLEQRFSDNSLGFAKKSWNREYGIGIQPETRENKSYTVGVYFGKENDRDFPIEYLHKRMLERTGKEGSSDSEWIWSHALNNDDLLIKMYTGEAATEFADLIKEIIKVAERIIDEHVRRS